ncbi:MAG: cation transporting ATPase C-terminal domain-containing protein, partial [Thermodesulfobacteriota bacterium]
LVIRTRKAFFRSKPGKYLLMATLLIVGLTLILPFSPLGEVFGFIPLSISFILLVGIIVGLFVVAAEITKGIFYRKVKF